MPLRVTLGRLRLPTFLNSLEEQPGDPIQTAGGFVTAGEPVTRPLVLSLPIHRTSDGFNRIQAEVLRAQARALAENAAAKMQGMYLRLSPDPDQNGWVLFGKTSLKYAEGGVALTEYDFELSDCVRLGTMRTHRPGRRVDIRDRREVAAPRDYRGAIRGLDDFASQDALTRHYLPVGATRIRGFDGRVVLEDGTITTGAGAIPYVDGAYTGETLAFDQAEDDMGLADVVVYDRQGFISDPMATYTQALLSAVDYWRLGEPSGTTATDGKGLSNGIYSGVAGYANAVQAESSLVSYYRLGDVAMLDDFSTDLIATKYAYREGSSGFAVAGSVLTMTAGQKGIARTDVAAANMEVIAKFVGGSTYPSGDHVGLWLRSQSSGDTLLVNFQNDGKLYIWTRVSGGYTQRAVTAGAITVRPGQDVWLRGHVVGNTVTAEVWITDPFLGGSAALSTTFDVSGIAQLASGVSGNPGIRADFSTTGNVLDDFQVKTVNVGSALAAKDSKGSNHGTFVGSLNTYAAKVAAESSLIGNWRLQETGQGIWDDFSADLLATKYTYREGSSGFSVGSGVLSNSGAAGIARNDFAVSNTEVIVKVNSPANATTIQGGPALWARSQSNGDTIYGQWDTTGGPVGISTRVGGTYTPRATGGSLIAANNTSYWLRLTTSGNTVTMEAWTTDPDAGGSAAISTTYDVSAITQLNSGVSGNAGIRHGGNTGYTFDEFRVRPLTAITAVDAKGTSNGTYQKSCTGGAIGPLTVASTDLATSFVGGSVGGGLKPWAGYVTVPDAAALKPLTTFSVEAWIKPAASGDYQMIFTKGLTASPEIELRITPALAIDAFIRTTGASLSLTGGAGAALTAGVWQLVTLTYSGSAGTIYVNGIPYLTGSGATGNISHTANPALIGKRADTQQFNFTGDISEVSYYNATLTAQRVGQHYAARLTTHTFIPGQTGALVAGDTDTATLFDGATSYVSVPDAANLRFTTAFTLEAWVKLVDTGTRDIVNKGPFGGDYNLLTTSGRLRLDVGAHIGALSTTAMSTGTWYHVAATYDGSTIRYYLNGVADGTESFSGTAATSANALWIGARSDPALFFNGTIDEVAVYNAALSAAQIALHYAERTATPGPAYTLAQTGAVAGDTAVDFNGRQGYVAIPDNTGLRVTNNFTIGGFIKPGAGAGEGVIFGKGAGGGDYYLEIVSAGGVAWLVVGGAIKAATTATFTAGTWYHLLVTYDGSNVRFYVNGDLESTTAVSFSATQTSGAAAIGAMPSGGKFFKGTIDDVAIWPTALSAGDVEDLYIEATSGETGLYNPLGDDIATLGWLEIFGPDQELSEDDVPVVENGAARSLWDPTISGFALTAWDDGEADYVEQGRVTIWRDSPHGTRTQYTELVSAFVPVRTEEKCVIMATLETPDEDAVDVYVTMQRGWTGPRVEAYPANSSQGVSVRYTPLATGVPALTRSGGVVTWAAGDLGTYGAVENWLTFTPHETDTAFGFIAEFAVIRENDMLAAISDTTAYGSARNAVAFEGTPEHGTEGYASVRIGYTDRGTFPGNSIVGDFGSEHLLDQIGVPELVEKG